MQDCCSITMVAIMQYQIASLYVKNLVLYLEYSLQDRLTKSNPRAVVYGSAQTQSAEVPGTRYKVLDPRSISGGKSHLGPEFQGQRVLSKPME